MAVIVWDAGVVFQPHLSQPSIAVISPNNKISSCKIAAGDCINIMQSAVNYCSAAIGWRAVAGDQSVDQGSLA
jgi:hypothetical protein